MIILTLNCGSSSVKYMLYSWNEKKVMAEGIIQRVTMEGSFCIHKVSGGHIIRIDRACPNHTTAIKLAMDMLTHGRRGVIKNLSDIDAVGHRVVHGGEKLTQPAVINDQVLQTIRKLSDLAPLHNPPNVLGIEAAQRLMPHVPHIAVMDTAWHQTMLPSQYIYALPYEWHQKYGIRRYGFHGISFLYIAKRAALLLGEDPFKCNIISLHIGNGASVNAVKDGISFDTSMGFTPLEGLVMGTRAGDHDAAIDLYRMKKKGYSPEEIEDILNKKSGLFGITGKYIDHREVFDAAKKGDKRAELALSIEVYRIKKYIGAYVCALGKVDAIVWTAGVGEMSDIIRGKAMDGLEFIGIKYDAEKNKLARSRNAEFDISATDSKVKIFVIPTDEELVITEDVVALIEGRYDVHTNFKYTFEHPKYRNKMRDINFAKELKKEPKKTLALANPFPNELLPKEARPYAWWLNARRT